MAEFHLLRPWALLLLLLLPPLYWLLSRRRQQGRFWSDLLPPHLHQAMLHLPQGVRQQASLWWPLATLVIGALALSGPTWDKQPVPLFQLQQGRVLVMDMSASMWATDLTPNRLTHARYKAQDLLTSLDEGEMGLVAYAGDAFTLSPLASDRSSIANMLPVLSPEIMPVAGSNLPKALAAADQLLKDAGHQQGEILLITDGVLPEYLQASLDAISAMPWQLNILALGSAAGAPMQQPDGELIRSLDGSVALARTDYDALGKLARAGNGKLVPYQADGSDLAALSQQRPLDANTSSNGEKQALWQDRGGYLLLLLAPLLAFSLRRHGLLALLPFTLLVSPHSEAGPWQTDDQQGQTLFEQQQYQAAAEQFNNPAWKGSAYYRAGDYQQSLDAFNQADGVDALYNQGNALAQLGDLQQAIDRYQQVLDQQPDHPGAAANKQLLEQLQQNQQQQQDGDSSGDAADDSEQQQSESNSDSQSQRSDGNQSPSQQQSQPGQSPSDQPSSSQDSGNDPAADAEQNRPQSQPQPPQSSESQPSPSQGEQPQSQPQAEQGEQSEQADSQSKSAAESSQSENGESQDAEQPPTGSAKASESQQDQQQKQQLQQRLDQIPDDPSLLLRNKMQLEYERRRFNGEATRERTSW